ncbi:g4812 [Coccomyxa elongata]
MASTPSSAGDSLLVELWKRGVWRVLPILFFYVTSLTVLAPVKPSIMTDFFASRAANQTMRCDDYMLSAVPKACQDAHAQVVTWSSWADFVANSVLAFFMAPVVGRWSDAYGRKPFLILSFACGGAQVIVLLLYITWGTSLLWYFPAQAAVGAFSCISLCLAYVADKMPARHRGATFGFIMASFSFGVVIGPMAGVLLSPLGAAWFAVGGAAFNCLYTALLLPESLSPEARKLARRRQGSEKARPLQGLCSGLRMLGRSPLFLKLTACVMLTGIVMEGMYELLAQYFQLKLGYTASDQSLMLVVAGCAGLVVNTVVLRFLLHFLGETGVLYIGLSVSCVQQVCIAFAWTKPLSVAAVAIGSLGNMSFPAISAIKSKSVPRHEQGAMQGALFGARSLATGLGPVLFATAFSFFSRSGSRLPFFPGAPFIGGAVLVFIGLVVALTIRTDDVRRCQVDDGLTAPLLDGDESKAAHSELEGVFVSDGVGAGGKADMLSAHAEPDGQQLPVSYAAEAPAAAGGFVISTASAPATVAGQEEPQNLQDLINNGTSVVPGMRERPSGATSIASRGSAVQQSDPACQADMAQKPTLARKKSVRFAEDDSAASRAALAAAAAALSGAAAAAPERPLRAADGPCRAAEGPGHAAERPAFCWSLLDNFAPGDLLDAQLDTGMSSVAAEEVCQMERGRWRSSMRGEGVDPEVGMLPRRSEDLRLADRATLSMAAFGGTGMETSSAVIRTLQASHEVR